MNHDEKITINLDQRELGAVLAGLAKVLGADDETLEAIATDCGSFPELPYYETRELAERINTAPLALNMKPVDFRVVMQPLIDYADRTAKNASKSEFEFYAGYLNGMREALNALIRAAQVER